jgi:hypothetical protein
MVPCLATLLLVAAAPPAAAAFVATFLNRLMLAMGARVRWLNWRRAVAR